MKECKKCSKQYDDSFVFCPDCGERLSPSAPKISKRNALLIVCIAAALLIAGGSVGHGEMHRLRLAHIPVEVFVVVYPTVSGTPDGLPARRPCAEPKLRKW